MMTWFSARRIRFCKEHPIVISALLAGIFLIYLLKTR
jgi:hypothetical protein